jgi:hypothetical protein
MKLATALDFDIPDNAVLSFSIQNAVFISPTRSKRFSFFHNVF